MIEKFEVTLFQIFLVLSSFVPHQITSTLKHVLGVDHLIFEGGGGGVGRIGQRKNFFPAAQWCRQFFLFIKVLPEFFFPVTSVAGNFFSAICLG